MRKLTFIKTLLLFVMILTLFLAGFSKTETIMSSWADSPLNIDGSHQDWTDQTFHSEKRLSIDYAFQNDEENLFAIFIFRDPRYLSTINATGITIWFNTEGKKKKNYGIKFTKKQISAEAFIAYLEQKRGPLPEEEKNTIRAKSSYFLHNVQVISKGSTSSAESPEKEEIIPTIFRTTKQQEGIVYEFAIPLKRITENAPGIRTEPGKTIKVGFEWGGMTDEMKAAKIRRLQGASGGSPERPTVSPETRAERGQVGVSESQVGQGPKKYSFWADVQLARKQ